MKAYKILIVIVIVLAGILGFKIYSSNHPDAFSKRNNNGYTLEDAKILIEKGNNQKNYKCVTHSSSSKRSMTYMKLNDKVYLEVINEDASKRTVSLFDYRENIWYIIDHDKKKVTKASLIDIAQKSEVMVNTIKKYQQGVNKMTELAAIRDSDCKIDKVTPTQVVLLIDKYDFNNLAYKQYYYVNKETGLIDKIVNKQNNSENTITYNYTIDSLKESDFALPSNYKVYTE